MKLKIGNDTRFWLYVITKSAYKDYIKSKSQYLTFFEKKVNKGDIIIIFNKDRSCNGFGGIVQLETNPENNEIKQINIFKNNNLNRFYSKVSFKLLFTSLIRIESIVEHLKTEATGFKNIASFRSKFMKNDNTVIEMPLYGKRITDKLVQISEEENNKLIQSENSNSASDEKNTIKLSKYVKNIAKKKNIQIVEESDNEPEEQIVKSNNDNENSCENDNETLSESDDEDISDLENKNNIFQKSPIKKNYHANDDDDDDDDDENIENSEDTQDKNEDSNGFIPLLIIPCDLFKFPQTNKDKYFRDHYKNCNKCDITNNNNRELCSILDKATLQVIEIKDEKHGYFNPALDAYFNLKKYEPMDSKETPFIRVMNINNDHEFYNNCLLIAWCV